MNTLLLGSPAPPLDGAGPLEILDDAECRRLLDTASIGRLAFSEDALPAVRPVSYAVHDDRIVIPARVDSSALAALRWTVVAFHVDSFLDAAREDLPGWSVTVVGMTRVVTDPADVAKLDGTVAPWLTATTHCYLTVDPGFFRGWRCPSPVPGATSGRRIGHL